MDHNKGMSVFGKRPEASESDIHLGLYASLMI